MAQKVESLRRDCFKYQRQSEKDQAAVREYQSELNKTKAALTQATLNKEQPPPEVREPDQQKQIDLLRTQLERMTQLEQSKLQLVE